MSIDIVEGRAVHFPNNPEKFEFDEEVAQIFPEMAFKSIPQYREAHSMHVALLKERLVGKEVHIVDVGASRGGFISEVCRQCQIDPKQGHEDLTVTAFDQSPHMLKLLRSDFPWISTVCCDARDADDLIFEADIIVMAYLLQFIREDSDKEKILRWAYRNLKPGGVLILGQKEEVSPTYAEDFQEQYYQWRERNGYTREEIRKKADALKNSMWPIHADFQESLVYHVGFSDYVETSRWLQFSTSIAFKR